MPIYEYRCPDCARKFSALIGMTAEPDDEKCPHCGGTSALRLVSRFARYRSEDARVDALADELETMGEPDSPSRMREMVREMGKAMDEDLSEEMEEMFESDFQEDDAGPDSLD
jgi:putative FmdB family regulatory protein